MSSFGQLGSTYLGTKLDNFQCDLLVVALDEVTCFVGGVDSGLQPAALGRAVR